MAYPASAYDGISPAVRALIANITLAVIVAVGLNADLIAFVQAGPAQELTPKPIRVADARREFRAGGVNGLTKFLHAVETAEQVSWLGDVPMHFCRQTDGRSRLARLTQPVPKDLNPDDAHVFRLAAAMGDMEQSAGTFQIRMNGKALLSFPAVVDDGAWSSDDGQVRMVYTPWPAIVSAASTASPA